MGGLFGGESGAEKAQERALAQKQKEDKDQKELLERKRIAGLRANLGGSGGGDSGGNGGTNGSSLLG